MYKDMNELIRKNNRSRDFFLSQPIYIQIEMKGFNEQIHTPEELYNEVDLLLNNKAGFYKKEEK